MTKDFKTAGATAASGQYGISWVLGGIAVGLLVGAVIYATAGSNPLQLANAANQTATANTNGTNKPVVDVAALLTDQASEPVERPDFSYHAVLPQLEVPLNITEPPPEPTSAPVKATSAKVDTAKATTAKTAEAKPEAAVKPQTASTATGTGRYLFQLGAYKTQAQATQMQKRASANGLNTRVEAAKINGETWYRVRLGPTTDQNTANRWQQRLAGMGISALPIR